MSRAGAPRRGYAAPEGGASSLDPVWVHRRKALRLRTAVGAQMVPGPALTLGAVGALVVKSGGLNDTPTAQARAFAAYTRQCAAFAGTPAYPPTADKILGFLYTELDRGVSNTHLGSTTSSLLAYFAATGSPLSAHATQLITAGRRLLEVEFPAEVRRARPLTDAALLRIRAFLDPYLRRGDLFALEWWALLTLGYGGLYRGCELLGSALDWSQVTYTRTRAGAWALIVDSPFRKTNKRSRDTDVDVHVVPPRSDTPALDPYLAMKAYADAAGKRMGVAGGPVFPARHKMTGAIARRDAEYSDDAARSHLRWLIQKAGLPNPEAYGLHSMRRGGATMLLAAGVDWPSVKKLGAWKSDAAELYDARGADLADAIAASLQPRSRLGRRA